jgi:hypothetical protein
MKQFKINFISAIFLFCIIFCAGQSYAQEPLETIYYNIKPVGACVYQDFGPVEYRGSKANLIVFTTNMPGFEDKEVIFSETETRLPIFVNRDISLLFRKEHITEEYSSRDFSLKVTKFQKGREVDEYFLKKNGPLQNAILLPFSLRDAPELKIGSIFNVILLKEFEVKVESVEDVVVPAGKFKAYHFTSSPNKFEIWISADNDKLPVKIKGLGALPYVLEMKERVFRKQ